MEYCVDRIEEGIAVCERAQGEVLHVRREMLPADVREGCILDFTNGQWSVLHARTQDARHEIFLLQESLFDA